MYMYVQTCSSSGVWGCCASEEEEEEEEEGRVYRSASCGGHQVTASPHNSQYHSACTVRISLQWTCTCILYIYIYILVYRGICTTAHLYTLYIEVQYMYYGSPIVEQVLRLQRKEKREDTITAVHTYTYMYMYIINSIQTNISIKALRRGLFTWKQLFWFLGLFFNNRFSLVRIPFEHTMECKESNLFSQAHAL